MEEVKIINLSPNPLPKYETSMSAGMDVRANLKEPYTLKPMERHLIPTGIKMELPEGFECQVRPRSGMALKYGITVLNTPGTIDADYRGEVGVILMNLSNEDFIIHNGDKIAQMVFTKYSKVNLIPVSELSETGRGEGGFGSTGK